MKQAITLILLVILCTTLSVAQVELEKGLVGWYSFDEVSVDTIVNQATGENKAPDGILMADTTTYEYPEYVEGISGNALWFTTENFAHVGLGVYDPSADTDLLSISCWIFWEGLDGVWQPICGLRDGWDPPTIGWSMVLDQTSGGLQFETNTSDGKVFIITPEPPTLEDWTHVALTFDGEWATYYFDGVWMVDGEMQFGEGRSTSPFRIGAGWSDGNGFKGMIDEFRIYNRILTEEEIKFLHENPGGGASRVEDTKAVPSCFTLEQNYPNPFNPTTTISYSFQNTDHVTLQVYNMMGENVATLVDEFQNGGRYSVSFDAGHLPGGIYLYRLGIGKFQQSKKMILLK